MALFDFLKRKKQAERSKKGREEAKKPVKSLVDKKSEEAGLVKPKPKKTKIFSYQIVKEPHISEKSTYLAEKNQYVFKVLEGYNKKEIKNAVEGIYGVDVLSVNLVNIPAKKRRLGKTQGFKKGYKKAIVKIKEGQKIEIL